MCTFIVGYVETASMVAIYAQNFVPESLRRKWSVDLLIFHFLLIVPKTLTCNVLETSARSSLIQRRSSMLSSETLSLPSINLSRSKSHLPHYT